MCLMFLNQDYWPHMLVGRVLHVIGHIFKVWCTFRQILVIIITKNISKKSVSYPKKLMYGFVICRNIRITILFLWCVRGTGKAGEREWLTCSEGLRLELVVDLRMCTPSSPSTGLLWEFLGVRITEAIKWSLHSKQSVYIVWNDPMHPQITWYVNCTLNHKGWCKQPSTSSEVSSPPSRTPVSPHKMRHSFLFPGGKGRCKYHYLFLRLFDNQIMLIYTENCSMQNHTGPWLKSRYFN